MSAGSVRSGHSAGKVIQRDIQISSNSQLPNVKFPDQYYANTQEDGDSVDPEIEDIWKRIDYQIKSNATSQPAEHKFDVEVTRRFRVIRVFVSSTFTDFFNEREVLVKQVFPELREWCFARNMDLIECDLRWGVPSDSTSDQTITTCLSELDRCHEDNDGQPFFIGMLSEKYGWVPTMDNLAEEIKTKYNWIPKLSITSMEFLHGALRCRNRNACFFIRSPESISDIPAEYYDKFFENDSFSKLQLKALKKKLKKYHPNQVFEYQCKYDGIDETTGRKKVKLSGLTEFGQTALEFLKKSIETFYPDSKLIEKKENNDEQELNDTIEDEKYYQHKFMLEKTSFFVDRQRSLDILTNYIDSGQTTDEFSLVAKDKEQIKSGEHKSNTPLIVLGDEGSGKSSLIAQLSKKLIEAKKKVFYFFFDASIFSQQPNAFFPTVFSYFSKFLTLEMGDNLNIHELNPTDTKANMAKLVAQLGQLTTNQVILVDGFHHKQNTMVEFIPRNLPPNVKLIFSCSRNDTQTFEDILGDEIWYKVELENFDYECSKLFVDSYLKKYNKKLDDKQMTTLLNKSLDNKLPLWLSYVCNELRVFGEFATINRKIEQLPAELEGLMAHIFDRINSDFRDNIVKEVLCLISITQNGIPENEVMLLMKSVGIEINRLEWAQMLRSLKIFFSFIRFKNTQLVALKNRILLSHLNNRYFNNNEKIRSTHVKLLEYFKNLSVYRNTAVLECCYHYENVNQPEEFVEFLNGPEAMKFIRSNHRAFLLNKYRCPFQVKRDEKECVKMCVPCSFKKRFVDQIHNNEMSCMICGSWVFTHSPSLAFKCMRHGAMEIQMSKTMFKCCFCNMNMAIPQGGNAHLLYKKAKLCQTCSQRECCMFNFSR